MSKKPSSWDSWDADTKTLFSAIRTYRRDCVKYIQGRPDPDLAKRCLDDSYVDLMKALSDPSIKHRLAEVITAGAWEEERTIAAMSNAIAPSDMALEISLAPLFGIDPKDVEKAVAPNTKELTLVHEFTGPDDLIRRLDMFHEAILAQAEEARAIKPRGIKKKRKRDLRRATYSILFGSGCFVANSYAIPYLPGAASSYGAGAGAFFVAIRDIVGELPKD